MINLMILSIYCKQNVEKYSEESSQYDTPVPTKGIKNKKELKEIYEQEKEDAPQHFEPEEENQ